MMMKLSCFSACVRWSSDDRFEGLLLIEDAQWPVWVVWDAITVQSPVEVVYRRRHHRAKFVTQTSRKCQECGHLKFVQVIANRDALSLALLEAQASNSV